MTDDAIDPFDAAVAREARYDQAINSAKDWATVLFLVVTLAIHALVVGRWTGMLWIHAVIAGVTLVGAVFAWVHDDLLHRRPVISRWRNVVFVRRPGPRL